MFYLEVFCYLRLIVWGNSTTGAFKSVLSLIVLLRLIYVKENVLKNIGVIPLIPLKHCKGCSTSGQHLL